MEDFINSKISAGHNLRRFKFYNFVELCTVIYADFTDQNLIHQDFTTNLVKTTFGRNPQPTWTDFEDFL